ncbi:DUF3787 domain-containing protein [Corallococcus sp. CA053C]|nr:DUF3787 domain-containing protein [Corallococcus sp. CA053C]
MVYDGERWAADEEEHRTASWAEIHENVTFTKLREPARSAVSGAYKVVEPQ